MTQANIFQLAKQGDVQAITSLMNSQLQLKNVIAKVTIKNGYLQVRLESLQIPDQQNLVKYVRQEIIGLKSESIKKVKIYGFQQGKSFPCWSQNLNLESKPKYSSSNLGKQLSSNFSENTKYQENNININQSIFQKTLNHYQKVINPKIIAIAVLGILSIYLLKENNILKRQECILQRYLQAANTNCK
ncbi:hypothetical protein ACE1AT_22815 [Pelatocladus sp. BLCC-F211]|uniref:hypothetical protein n=1 Tax=Pelatocladus sp. BLCC-F211 TaxID=3342752 RepID=UPI0035B9C64C